MRKGLSLLELLVTMSLLAIVSVGVGTMIVQWNRAAQRQTTLASLASIRQTVLSFLNDPTAWEKTLSDPDNAVFACVQSLSSCAAFRDPDAARTFSVRDRSGNVFYDGKDPAAGFTQNGSPCANYPGAGCPLRLVLTWRADCAAGATCVAPLMKIDGAFVYDAGKRGPAFNAATQNFQLVKYVPGTAPGEPGQTIESQLGTFCALVKAHAGDASFDAQLAQQLTDMGQAAAIPLLQQLKGSCPP